MSEEKVQKLFSQALGALAVGKLAIAEIKLRKARLLQPADPQIGLHLAATLFQQQKLVEAISFCQDTLRLSPDYPQAWYNLALCLDANGQKAEAGQALLNYLKHSPDDVRALNNAGAAFLAASQLETALDLFDRAISLEPGFAGSIHNRAQTLKCLGRFDEALAAYAAAQQLDPDFVEAHWGEATCRLKIGDFARGWEKYEWRLKRPQLQDHLRKFTQPMWQGESLAGKTLFLYAAQGMGDTIQFFRYVQRLVDMGAQVIVEVQLALIPLLSASLIPCTLIGRGEDLSEYDFDFHFPLLSLPRILKTSLDNIPAKQPYVDIPQAYQEKWQALLGPHNGKPRIGLAWTGSATHEDDLRRSMSLADCQAMLGDDFDFFVIQKDIRPADKKLLALTPHLHCLAEHVNDFADTAALTAQMDLVISVDTANAHVAGAIGKPCWLMLPEPAEWRWLLERDDSPWHPSMRLFRQREPGNWAHVIDNIRGALQTHSFHAH